MVDRFKGRLFLTVLRGLVASNVHGADFQDVSIAETEDGFRLSCIIRGSALRKADADTRGKLRRLLAADDD